MGAMEGVVRAMGTVRAVQGAGVGSRLWDMEAARGMDREVVMRSAVGMEGSREVGTSSGVDMSREGMTGVRAMVVATDAHMCLVAHGLGGLMLRSDALPQVIRLLYRVLAMCVMQMVHVVLHTIALDKCALHSR